MKKLLLSLVVISAVLLASTPSGAQVPYINAISQPGGAIYNAMTVTDSSYVIATRRNATPRATIDFVKFDTAGAVVDSLVLTDSSWDFGNRPKTLHFRNNELYYANSNSLGLRSAEVVFFTIKGNLQDTIRTHHFIRRDTIQFNGTTWHVTGQDVWATEFDSDSTFIASGCQVRNGFVSPDSVLKYDLFVARFDTAYNLLWSTVVPEVDQFRGQEGPVGCDIELDAYGSMIVSGNPWFYTAAQLGFAARIRVSDGHLYWYREYPGGQDGLWGMYCVDNGDGTYQFVQNWSTHPTGGYNQVNIGQMDISGNILQQKRYFKPNRVQATIDLLKTSDGDYYTAGVSYFREFYSFGFKFDASLDSIFAIDLVYDQVGNRSEIYSFKEEPNSSRIIHAGLYVGSSAPGANSWLKQIDLRGCMVSNCDISVRENDAPTLVSIYPNPAENHLFLEWESSPELARNVSVQIINMLGQPLIEDEVSDASLEEFLIDVSSLVSGSYIVKITSQHGYVQTEALLVR
ncbi:MAG: T9SS type A sorting domain-containing protein [Flavobacteriia bacterium]|nr:T9SS type A sorting domain-containing protein [Flavobacteriia bacterium]